MAPPDANRPPVVSGRSVVALFVGAALVAGGVSAYLRYTNRSRILDAQRTALPTLKAQFALECVDPASPDRRNWRDEGCPASATLTLSPESRFGDGTRSVLYALVSSSGAIVGRLDAHAPAQIPLRAAAAGPNMLVEVLSAAALEPKQLEDVLAREPGATLERRLQLLRGLVDGLRNGGHDTRVEGLSFEVLAPPAARP